MTHNSHQKIHALQRSVFACSWTTAALPGIVNSRILKGLHFHSSLPDRFLRSLGLPWIARVPLGTKSNLQAAC